MKKLLFFLMVINLYILNSCTSDKLPEPMPPDNCDEDLITYNMEIKPIIDTYCAFGTCHADNSDAPGNFTTYAGMQAYLNDDGIKRYCVDLRKDANEGMPPNWAINTGPHDFTDEDFEKIECWINLNYPE